MFELGTYLSFEKFNIHDNKQIEYIFTITSGEDNLSPLNICQINEFCEPFRMFLFATYGYFNHIKKTYSSEELKRELCIINNRSYIIGTQNLYNYSLSLYEKVGFKKLTKFLTYLMTYGGINIHNKDLDGMTPFLNVFLYCFNYDKKIITYFENIGANIYTLSEKKYGFSIPYNAYLLSLNYNDNYKHLKYLESRDLHLRAKYYINDFIYCNSIDKFLSYKFNMIYYINPIYIILFI